MRSLLITLVLMLLPLHLVWASASECRDQHIVPTPIAFPNAAPAVGFSEMATLSDFAGSSAIDLTAISAMASRFDDWEFFDDDLPDIAEQLSALDLRDVRIDKLSCSLPVEKTAAAAGALDPHEFDLPNHAMVHHLASTQSAFSSFSSSLISAPVFRTYRPPMTTL